MIVTRQRKKPFPWRRLLLPVIAIALVIFAFTWAPSRNVITNGPAAPVFKSTGNIFGSVSEPFHFAAQNQVITDKNRQIVALQNQLNDAKSKTAAKDKQIADLQAQTQQLQSQAATLRSNAPTKGAPPVAAAGTPNGVPGAASTRTQLSGDLTSTATPDMRRTAQYWSSMDPENAAKVVQKLPVDYVARVFSLMSSDSVGSILDALPPNYAAQITQEHPELRQ